MDPDDGAEGDEPLLPWLPPDDRLWRHPSEVATERSGSLALATRDPDRRVWAVALLAGLVGAVLASGAGVVTGGYHRSTTVIRPIEQVFDPSPPVITVVSDPKAPTTKDPGVAIAERLAPTIVELVIGGNGTDLTASGVIFRSDGYVLTNQHVIGGGGNVVAIMHDGRRVVCSLVGADPATDIAVLKLPQGTAMAVAPLGSSLSLKVGEWALTVGFRLGVTQSPSVTQGIISALGLDLDPGFGAPLVDMIQTDATVAPGSSGGALVDDKGYVVGITNALAVKSQATDGRGFATPIEVARDVAEQLVTSGKVVHVWLGVAGMDVDGATASQLGIAGGAVVEDIDESSPAAKAGIAVGDIIVGFAGQPIGSTAALDAALRQQRPGQHVTISFIRNGRQRSANSVLVIRPTGAAP